MNSEIADEIVEELASTFQKLETQSAALLEFVKDKGLANEGELAPYIERAAAASAVRWRATRVRMAHLFASAEKKAEERGTDRNKAEDREKSQTAKESVQGDEHSQDKESIKHAENLGTGPVGAPAENNSTDHAEERSEKPVQKSSNSRVDTEKTKVEPAGQMRPSREQSEKRTGDADQSSAGKDGQSVATGSRKSNDNDKQDSSDRHNVA